MVECKVAIRPEIGTRCFEQIDGLAVQVGSLTLVVVETLRFPDIFSFQRGLVKSFAGQPLTTPEPHLSKVNRQTLITVLNQETDRGGIGALRSINACNFRVYRFELDLLVHQ